jgi:hypothetical protein
MPISIVQIVSARFTDQAKVKQALKTTEVKTTK